MAKKIEIRCKKERCNRLFMNYYIDESSSEIVLQGIELKCEKCKRVLRLYNYNAEVLKKQCSNNVLKV